MPNDDSSVRIQLLDGTTGRVPKRKADAWVKVKHAKIIDDGSPTYSQLTAQPFSSEADLNDPSLASRYFKTVGSAVMGAPEQLAHAAIHPIGALTGMADWVSKGVGAWEDPKTRPTWEGIKSVLPEALGLGTGMVATGEIGEKVGEIGGKALSSAKAPSVPKVEVPGKGAARQVLGLSAKDVEIETVRRAKSAARKEIRDTPTATRAKEIESAKQTELATKKAAESHGPVFQRMNTMAEDAAKHIGEVEGKVRTAEGAKWEAFKNKMEDAPVETESTVNAIAHAQENILTGDSLPIFKQVLNEIAEDDPLAQASVFRGKGGVDIKEFLRHANPQARERMLRQLQDQGIGEEAFGMRAIDIPLDLARRLYTKINRKLNASELPRDVQRALVTVQKTLDEDISKAIIKKGGAPALREYRDLQASWRQYRETFSDKDSPLRKIVEAKDPKARLNPITGDTGPRANQYLGRYRDLGADPSKLGKIQAINTAVRELATRAGKAGKGQEKALGDKPPGVPAMSPEDMRRSMMDKMSASWSRPSRFEVRNPMLAVRRMILKAMIQNPKFIDWISKGGGAVP